VSDICSLGVYLPLLRLERAAAATALRWSGLGGGRTGRRSVAAWDEDAVTLAVEAARDAVSGQDGNVDEVIFASTSAPFQERQHAGLVVDGLHLSPRCRTADTSGSRRSAVSALLSACRSNSSSRVLIAAGEKRPTKPGSAAQVAWGDGGAAALVGDKGFLRLRGSASLSHDLVDVYSSREHPTPYPAEERFVRDTAISAVLLPTIRDALTAAGVAAADIAHAIVPEPVPATYKPLAAKLGLKATNTAERVQASAGDLGSAHALFSLALAVETASKGDLLLLVGFGSGCDALVFEMIDAPPPTRSASEALRHGVALTDYIRFLSLQGNIDLDWGPRSELEQKTAAPVLERYGRDMLGFIGGRDSTGNVQFPKSRVPVAPDADHKRGLVDVRLADEPARIQSLTADRLNFTPDPPFNFGLVQFANGARVLMEFCDAPQGALHVGADVAMRFRIKSIDRRRGFRTYFWKACPAHRPDLGS
jgi:hydroxymethylglutaryl-CoA synthase